ncbi:MAG: MnmC family methyltransferase [Pseudomonadota bacterium]
MSQRDWVPTADGTVTLRAANGETYNDLEGGVHTAFSAFAYGASLLMAGERVSVLDIGFGLGVNAAAAWATLRDIGAQLVLTAIEPDTEILDCFGDWPAPFTLREPREDMAKAMRGQPVKNLEIRLIKQMLQEAGSAISAGYHAIFFDPWSPAVQPELWQPELLADLYKRLRPGGHLVARSHGTEPLAPFTAAGLDAELLRWPGGRAESVRVSKPKP